MSFKEADVGVNLSFKEIDVPIVEDKDSSRRRLQEQIMKLGNSPEVRQMKGEPGLSLDPGPDKKIKNILLVKSPTTVWETNHLSISSGISEEVPEPLGLCYLAAVLRDNGYEPEIFDPHLEVYEEYRQSRDPELIKESVRKKFAQGGYDLVGVSSMYLYAYKWGHHICAAAKKANEDIPVVIGGGHPSVVLGETMKDENIDYLIEGEGEIAFLALLHALNTSRTPKQMRQIPALLHRDNGQVIHNERQDYIWDLDNIPFPAWDLINVDRYMNTYAEASSARKKTLMMITQRGCPFKCTFCNVFESWGYRFRKRSSENVLGEIDYLIENYGVEEIMFVDDNMTIDKKRMMEICEGLKSRPIRWRVVNIASFVTNEEMLRAMKESGCTKVSISVESASEKVLEAMKKPVDLEWSEDAIRICHEIKLPITVNFITGMPYETKEDMMKTFKWAEKVGADWSTFSVLVPYPGTEIFEYSKKRGYLDPDSLNLEGLTQRNPTIETETWTREWVADRTYHYNVLINFIKNYNLIEKDGNLPFVTGFLENIVMHHPRHLIGKICLAYAYHRVGNSEEANELLAKAKLLLDDPEVMETYGSYLDLDEKVMNFFRDALAEGLPDRTTEGELEAVSVGTLGSIDFYGETISSE